MLRVGLTGGIAAGKSTVARHLVQLGAYLIDYDQLSHEITGSGGSAIEPIRELFGSKSISADGSLNRSWMSQKIFGSLDARRQLEAIQHPLIFEQARKLEAQLINQDLLVVHDIPLLFDIRQSLPFDFAKIITVEASKALRIERMVKDRHLSEDQAVARINSQASQSDRELMADLIIDSSQPLEQMFEQVDKIYKQLYSKLA